MYREAGKERERYIEIEREDKNKSRTEPLVLDPPVPGVRVQRRRLGACSDANCKAKQERNRAPVGLVPL